VPDAITGREPDTALPGPEAAPPGAVFEGSRAGEPELITLCEAHADGTEGADGCECLQPASLPGPQRDSANERVMPPGTGASHARSSRACGAGEPWPLLAWPSEEVIQILAEHDELHASIAAEDLIAAAEQVPVTVLSLPPPRHQPVIPAHTCRDCGHAGPLGEEGFCAGWPACDARMARRWRRPRLADRIRRLWSDGAS
jgi:hypothetical protein